MLNVLCRFLFNDSEVKPFDPAQIAQECFGGEMTNTTYDTMTDKFMDFTFEKVRDILISTQFLLQHCSEQRVSLKLLSLWWLGYLTTLYPSGGCRKVFLFYKWGLKVY